LLATAFSADAALRTSRGNPSLGDEYRNLIEVSRSNAIALPPGTWKVNNTFTAQPGQVLPRVVTTLLNEEKTSPFKLMITWHWEQSSSNWRPTDCERKANPYAIAHSFHDTSANAVRIRCSQYIPLSNAGNYFLDRWKENENYARPISTIPRSFIDTLPQDMVLLHIEATQHNGLRVIVNVFMEMPEGEYASSLIQGFERTPDTGKLHQYLADWREKYVRAVDTAYLGGKRAEPESLAFNWAAVPRSLNAPAPQTPSVTLAASVVDEPIPATTPTALPTASPAPQSTLQPVASLATGAVTSAVTNAVSAAGAATVGATLAALPSAAILPSIMAEPVAAVLNAREAEELAKLAADAKRKDEEMAELRQQLARISAQLAAPPPPPVDAVVAAVPVPPPLPAPVPVVATAPETLPPLAPIPKRKALVIGNDQYLHVPKLENARADARAIETSLKQVGFNVTLALDLTERGFKETLRNFKSSVAGGDEVVVFFAGHGVQLGSTNYLLPIDIAGQNEDQVRDEAIQLQRILDDMQERRTGFSLMIVDACRDNPFKVAGRSIGGRGLAPTSAATGQMVIFSAGAGQQALDKLGQSDPEQNGLFTRLFLREMNKPGIPVDRVLRNVRSEVSRLARSVGHEQTPALYDQTLGDFYFRPSGLPN
jgi:hypothetical protein